MLRRRSALRFEVALVLRQQDRQSAIQRSRVAFTLVEPALLPTRPVDFDPSYSDCGREAIAKV